MTKLHNLSLEQTDIIDEGEQRIAPEDGVMNISFTNCSNKNVVQNGSIKKKKMFSFQQNWQVISKKVHAAAKHHAADG